MLEAQEALRDLLNKHPELWCVNEQHTGFVTLFRVYPKGFNAKAQYERELTAEAARDDLDRHNGLQAKVADKLWSWFRSGQERCGHHAPYISYTSGFRTTAYDPDNKDTEKAVIYALKAFPMNLNISPDSMRDLVTLVLAARDEVLEEMPPRVSPEAQAQAAAQKLQAIAPPKGWKAASVAFVGTEACWLRELDGQVQQVAA